MSAGRGLSLLLRWNTICGLGHEERAIGEMGRRGKGDGDVGQIEIMPVSRHEIKSGRGFYTPPPILF